jgi:DNA-binding response OmpR family regulator
VSLVLICTTGDVPEDLKSTVLWRDDVQRHVAASAGETLYATETARPSLVLIDGALPEAEGLIAELRSGVSTRSLSIAVFVTSETSVDEDALVAAGANLIVPLPCPPESDDRLAALMSVAPRRTSRLAVTLQFEATTGKGILTLAGTVLNLSERGMLVETDVALDTGTVIDFRIHLRDAPAPLIGCGHVVRQEGERRCGVQFYGLEADGMERVRRFVKA